MRYILSSLALLLFVSELSGQATPITPFDEISTFNGVHSLTAPFEIASPYQGVGPVLIYNTAQVDFTAGERIHLLPGFQASQFNGNGYFHAQIGAAPDFDVVFIEPNTSYPQVGQFEKIEMGIQLPPGIQSQVDQFSSSNYTSGINPFDPEEISLEVIFTNGNTSYNTYGFYYRELVRTPSAVVLPPQPPNPPYFFEGDDPDVSWDDQHTSYPWRIRWAPPTTGVWDCEIKVRLNNAPTFTSSVSHVMFECVGSSNHGWLEVGQSKWNLRYSGTHQSFFAIGQNIAWHNPKFWGYYSYDALPYVLYGGGYLDVLEWTKSLADNGGNMVRLVSRPHTYNFEWENLNNYDKGMGRAWELDQMFNLCETRNIKIFFCMEFHSEFGWPSEEADWNLNPYNLELPGIDHPEDFLTNSTAQQKYKAKLRYFLSRWGYSTSLGVFELLSEMDGWIYANSHHPQFNPGGVKFVDNQVAQYDQCLWHDEMLGYVKSLLAYRSILTSSCYGGTKGYQLDCPVYNSASLDITTAHEYYSERHDNSFRFDAFNKPLNEKGTHELWSDKPTVFDEVGVNIDEDPNTPGTPYVDPDDLDHCSDITFHNTLWATSMMGGIGTGLYWWQWSNNEYRENNFPALSAYFDGIDFENQSFTDPDHWEDISSDEPSLSKIEVFYNRSTNRNRIIGWVHNASAYYANLDENCPDRRNHTIAGITNPPFPKDDDPFSDPVYLDEDQAFKIRNVNNLATYTFDWYSTRGTGGYFSSENVGSDIFGNVWPTWSLGAYDWGFRAYRPGNDFRVAGGIPVDTLKCDDDTIQAYGNHELDSMNLFSYSWNFGNGVISNLRDPIITYSSPGTYNVVLIVSDGLGWTDTLRQTVWKPACNYTRVASAILCQSLSVYPNPFENSLNAVLDSTWNENGIFILYSIDGRIIQRGTFQSRFVTMIFESNEVGCYLLLFRDAKHEEMVKVIQQ